METLSVLRLLWRRRVLVVLGAVAALACGLAAIGRLGVGPVDGSSHRWWTATSTVQVDNPRSLVADAYASALTIHTQAVLLADGVTTEASRAAIARAAGIRTADLTVMTPAIDVPVRPSPLVDAGMQVAAAPPTPYVVMVSAAVNSPLIALVGSGRDPRVVADLSRAATRVLTGEPAAGTPDPGHRLVVRPLGGVVSEPQLTSGKSPIVAVAVALVLFIGWCGALVVASGLARAWRRVPA